MNENPPRTLLYLFFENYKVGLGIFEKFPYETFDQSFSNSLLLFLLKIVVRGSK